MNTALRRTLAVGAATAVVGTVAGIAGIAGIASVASADGGGNDRPTYSPADDGSGRDGGRGGDGTDGRGRDDLRAIGLTADQRLVRVDTRSAGSAREIGKVTGLTGDRRLVGIDHRVQDGLLYGVGNAGGLYTLSADTAKATPVGRLTVALAGTSFGVDFNPAADRLRIVSDTGQNLRHNLGDGTTVADGTLTYPPATAPATGVTGAAYTNNDLSPATAATLFDLDTTLDQIAIQSPANSGQLVPTGKLGVDASADAGFDIYSTVRDGVTIRVAGFATVKVGTGYRLVAVDLLTGRADDRGAFAGRDQVVDLAIPLNQL